MPYNRKYTITVKPTSKEYKEDKDRLLRIYDEFLELVEGSNNYLSVEKDGTSSVHLHAIFSSPLIKDKRTITKQFKGYHFHMELILYRDYDSIEDIWKKYTNKEKSDADRYTLLYGCMIPLEINNILDFENI